MREYCITTTTNQTIIVEAENFLDALRRLAIFMNGKGYVVEIYDVKRKEKLKEKERGYASQIN